LSKGYIGVTNRNWFMYLKENSKNQEINFWRKNISKFKFLEVGEPFFFLVKNDYGLKTERQVLGYGIYKRFEVLDINIAWDKYKNGNGIISKNEYINMLRNVIEKDNGDIGCIILDGIKIFNNPVVLSLLGIKNNNIEKGKGISNKEVNLIMSSGQSSISGIFDSWEILDEYVALKTVDRSAFFHKGTGIPMGIRNFFEIYSMTRGQRKDIKLKYKNIIYDAHFEMDSKESSRSRLFWTSEFRDILQQELPKYYEIFEKELDIENIQFPKIRFEKLDSLEFNVEIIDYEEIELDADSEEVEGEFNLGHISDEKRSEGKVTYFYSKKYERDPKNRADAIAYHGTKCKVCGFDFEKAYGHRGKGYIEIHHINPLSTVGEEVKIDPKKDLIPVCSNCHRMIHRRKNCILSIEDMIEIINRDIVTRKYV